MLLNISFLRTFSFCGSKSRRSTLIAESSVARACLALLVGPIAASGRATSVNPPKKTNPIIKSIPVPSFPFNHYLLVALRFPFEQARRQDDARHAQPLQESGTNARGLEYANHAAVLPDALFLKGEDLLHADHVLFHARDLGDVGDLAGAVPHARSLHND